VKLPHKGPFSRAEIAAQRREASKFEQQARRAAETDPAKAAEFQAQAEEARRVVAQMEALKRTGATPSVGVAPDGSPDLLSDIAQRVGFISSKPADYQGGEYDDLAAVLGNGAARMLRRNDGVAPDDLISEVNSMGGYNFASISDHFPKIAVSPSGADANSPLSSRR